MLQRLFTALLVAGTAAMLLMPHGLSLVGTAAAPACDADNGGLKLPQGFCAFVAADNLGSARHLTVASNGDVYVALRSARGGAPPLVALRDADGDGKLEMKEGFGARGARGSRSETAISTSPARRRSTGTR